MNVTMMTCVKAFACLLIAFFYAPFIQAQKWVGTDYSVSGAKEAVELIFSQAVAAPKVLMLDAGEPRLVLDWTDMEAAISGQDIGQGQKAIDGQGAVKRFRFAPRGEGGLRLVMELLPDIKFDGTQNLGDRLQVKFARQNVVVPNTVAARDPFDPFAYDIPIPRTKPSLNIAPVQINRATPSKPIISAQANQPHDPFTYSAPIPRLKPTLGLDQIAAPAVQATAPAGQTAVNIAPFDIYSPKKRIFKSAETPYPRTAPHLGAIQVTAGITARPKFTPKAPRKPVIVIDPGHGGYDPGAIGAKGTKEKHITSAVTKRLAASLRRTGRYQVVVTRTKDVYVDHDDRLRIARERGADLFISLHADATENGKAAGASVYTLADRAKNRSKKITHTQNWIVDVDLSEQTASVGDILVDLAQRKTQSHSAEFASQLVSVLEKSVPLVRNTHRRAGYYVLLAPDVPAVLLELGFISNAEDEKRLNRVSEQEKIVSAVVRAINGYFSAKKP